MAAYLDAQVVVRRPRHTLDVHLEAERGDVIAVIGPNGAGKSTLLRALAGLVPLDDGEVRCDGRSWERAGGARVRTQDRELGMVFQDGLLFPHLSALENAAFGPRSRGAGRTAARELARGWLSRLGVDDLADRRPGQLSGGQAQRVAIARGLASQPRLLLLDEPLSALDVGVAAALRHELGGHLASVDGVSILVTHDAIDAMTLATRVVVLDEGRVAQQGTPVEIARHPRTGHVARLVGLNVLHGASNGTVIRLVDGSVLTSTTPVTGEVNACFPPTAVTLSAAQPTGSARNRWHGAVTSVVPHGSAVRVHLDTAGGLIADVTPDSSADLDLRPGRDVWATVKAAEIAVYSAATLG